jgi:HAD superfamily hydrolase (TIGR01549 family)
VSAPHDRIDAVLFDLDDTLHDDSSAYKTAARRVAEDVAAEHGLSAERVYTAYVAEANNFWKRLSNETVSIPIHESRAQLWHAALRAAGNDDLALAVTCAARYIAYRSEVLELSPGALDLLIALRARRCRIGIVSNGFAATHHDKIDRLALRAHLDGLFLADEMGMVKPDPRVFTHACAVLGVDPARTAMVGDRYDRDIVGAQEAGLFTVWLDVHCTPLPPGATPPDATVTTIAAVLGVLPLGDRQEASAAAANGPHH